IIIENMKFCEYWGYERAQDAQWLHDGFNLPGTIPVCQIEKDYSNGATGQLRTRFQAFVESLEIKRIQSRD
ncbi:MAG: 2-hydroxyacyl-CoA dehydratase family protein, partial [Candidatus Limivicinus sp.]